MDPKVQEQLLHYADKVSQNIQGHAPQAWQLILGVTKLNSIQELLVGVILLILTIVIFNYVQFFQKKFVEDNPKTMAKAGYYDFPVSLWIFPLVIAYVSSGLLLIATLVQLLNVWSWVGVFYPEARIAHDILDKLAQATNK